MVLKSRPFVCSSQARPVVLLVLRIKEQESYCLTLHVEEGVDLFYSGGHGRVQMPCRLTSNQSAVICERYVYTDQSEWTKQMSKIDEIINNYQHRISILQVFEFNIHVFRSYPFWRMPLRKWDSAKFRLEHFQVELKRGKAQTPVHYSCRYCLH
jgi:hypothetical protein